jgi:peptidoglycan/LPS O-acetylase OafA/YrhL
LRIFPVYFLLLIALLFLNPALLSDSIWWHFCYASNFYFWIKGSFTGSLSHFWSLAVEEQFYLVWPAIILFVPTRFLTSVLIAGVISGVLFRLLIVTDTSDMGRLLMPGSLDSFCVGGLLSFGRNGMKPWYKHYLTMERYFIVLAFVLLVTVHLLDFSLLSAAQFSAIYLLVISVAFGILINRLSYNIETPFFKQILNNKILLYIGKISYGMYLFHNFIPYFYGIEMPVLPAGLSIYVIQFLRLLVLLTLSSLSWFIIEKPILLFKRRYTFL